MDDDVNRNDDPIPENPIEQAGDQLEQAAENVWEAAEEVGNQVNDAADDAIDHVAEAAEDAGEHISDTAENAWSPVEETAEQAAENIPPHGAEDAWDRVAEVDGEEFETEQPDAEIIQGVWSETDSPTEPAGHPGHQHTYAEEFVPDELDDCCDPQAKVDPMTSSEFASSPMGFGPEIAGPTITADDVRDIKADHYAQMMKGKTKEKRDFPVWAILLIILLVLCICVILPVLLVFGGGLAIFRGIFQDIGTFIPYLFV